MLDPNKKKIPQVQGQRRNCNKMVGGMKLCIEANLIPFRLVGGLKKKKKILVCTRTQRPPKRLSQTWLRMLVNANLTHAKCFQSRSTLCDPMDCSLPDTSVYGISQARILEWVSMPSFRGSFQPWDQTRVAYGGCVWTAWFYLEHIWCAVHQMFLHVVQCLVLTVASWSAYRFVHILSCIPVIHMWKYLSLNINFIPISTAPSSYIFIHWWYV